MQKWEYCDIKVTLYQEGTGGSPQELLYLRLPGQHPVAVTNEFGSLGLLNQLGAEGWELVDAEPGVFYLKRPTK